MARIYNTESPLLSAVKGYSEGQKQTQDEAYRQAMKDITQAQNRKDAEEFGLSKAGGYQAPKFDDKGNFAGYEDNQSNIGRDQGPMEALAPQFFKKVVNPAQPAQAPFVKDVSPSGVPIRTYPDEPQRAPQSGPAPPLFRCLYRFIPKPLY
jgi:hypothetical protein